MKKRKIYEFDPQIYPTRLWVAINPSLDDVKDVFGFLDEDGKEVNTDTAFTHSASTIAQTYSVYNKESHWKGCFVAIWRKADTGCGVISHETSHCADWLDDEIGGLGGVDGALFNTGEPRAYYVQWLAEKIEDVLKGRAK